MRKAVPGLPHPSGTMPPKREFPATSTRPQLGRGREPLTLAHLESRHRCAWSKCVCLYDAHPEEVGRPLRQSWLAPKLAVQRALLQSASLCTFQSLRETAMTHSHGMHLMAGPELE